MKSEEKKRRKRRKGGEGGGEGGQVVEKDLYGQGTNWTLHNTDEFGVLRLSQPGLIRMVGVS